MEHEPVTTVPLTSNELEEMLPRYVENADASKVIEQCRRVSARLDTVPSSFVHTVEWERSCSCLCVIVSDFYEHATCKGRRDMY